MINSIIQTSRRMAFGLVALSILCTPAWASDENAETWVQSLADNATGILSNPEISQDQVVEEFENLMIENTALRSFGRSALGAYSRTITDEEFEQFIELLEQYATSVVRGRFDEYAFQTIHVTGSTVDERTNFDYVSVASDIRNVEAETIAGVRWLLIHREGAYRVYDITVETPDESGTFSLLQTQREEFNSILSGNNGRIRALLRYLRTNIREAGMVPANEAAPRN